MALAYRGSPTTGTVHGGSTVTVAAPTGLASTDLVMITVFGGTTVTGNPFGFGAAQRSSTNAGTFFYAKFATSSEPASYTITFASNTIAVAACVAISGASGFDPTTLPSTFDPGTTSTSCAVPAITLAGSTDWLIGFFGFGQNVAPGTFSLPAGFTSRIAQFNSGAAASDIGMIAGDIQSITSGSTGTKTATTTGSANYPVGFIVGVTPGTGGTGLTLAIPTATATAAAYDVTPVVGTIITGGSMFPLPITVELLIAGTWTDVTDHVYQRDGIQITGGTSQVGDTPQPATCTLTLNNRDGRFSPNYTGGTYYPYLTANVQIRVAVKGAVSSSGNSYTGYRFWGKVPEWPPLSDISGSDIYVSITATGPLRQILKGGGAGSALAQYYSTLTGTQAPVAYWPAEEQPHATTIGSGVDGGTDMTVSNGTPKWKANKSFNGSQPMGVVNGSTWDGLTAAFGSSGDDIYDAPGMYLWTAPVTSADVRVVGAGGGGTKGQAGSATGGAGGGGGEFSRNSAMAFTVGSQYVLTVGTGGSPGNWNSGASNGTNSTITGDAATVTGHGGQGAGASGSAGSGGTGSTAPVHHDGGAGGGHPGSSNAGAGGGSSGGLSAAGNAGSTASGSTPGSGGAAPTGGGKGGDGGWNPAGTGNPALDGESGNQPGGGGGGGWANQTNSTQGGLGAAGRVELIYTPAVTPNNNVIRFLMQTPTWGGNKSKVLVRALTAGTVHQLDVLFDSTAQKLVLKGFNSVGTLLFTGNLSSSIAGQTLLVSAELATSGANVAWRLACVKPGGTSDFDSVTGTQSTATMGSVTEVIVAPNADITKTAVGHISVQYAFIGLQKVSKALAGYETELGIDRFVRLASAQALDQDTEFSEGNDHWGFENTTMGWAASNCSITQSSVSLPDGSWPTQGTESLLLTASGGAGTWSATSPTGTAGQPVQPGDIVSASADVYAPATLNDVFLAVNWYNSPGTLLSTTTGASQVVTAGSVSTLAVGKSDGSIAPAGAAWFSVTAGDAETVAASTLLYVDHVRVHPQMGVQTAKDYHALLKEVKELDQGIMKEAKKAWGLTYRTRIRLINQNPAVTLDYSKGEISPPLAPVLDDQNLKNNIIVHRNKGSKVEVALQDGQMSILEPPQGKGRYKKNLKVVAAADEQLAALASHLLLLGTVSDARYPTITVDLTRAAISGNALAPLMSAVAAAEVGDMVQLVNLPFWFPSTSTQQLILGYSEQINANPSSSQPGWVITWNCSPYVPYVQVDSQIRRW